MSILEKSAKSIAEFVYKRFEANGSGNMILLTTMTGIALSSLAQTAAILINHKYSPSQKAFMVPQELTEGIITLLSIFLIATPLQKLSKKAVKSGKIYSKEMGGYMKKYGIFNDRLKDDKFDFASRVNKIVDKVKKTDEFVKSSASGKEALLKEHNDILQQYDVFSDSTSAITTTAGSLISTACISPYVRNYTASYYQKLNMNVYDRLPNKSGNSPAFEARPYNYINPCRI